MAHIAILEAAVASAPGDKRAAVSALANYREMVWRGESQPGILSEGADYEGPWNNPYLRNRAGDAS